MTANAARPRSEHSTEVLDLLRQAAVLRACAATFAYPDGKRRAAVAEMLTEVARAERSQPAPGTWQRTFDAVRALWANAGEEAESEYVRLFLGAAPCSLHETSWGDGRRAGGREAELADIAGFYAAFGFELSRDAPDLHDHLGAELEFAAALLAKEAWAVAQGLDGPRAVTREALARFLEVHLGRWPRALGEGLVAANAGALPLAIVDLAVAVVDDLCVRRGVSPHLADGRIDDREPDCLHCPLAGEPAGEAATSRSL